MPESLKNNEKADGREPAMRNKLFGIMLFLLPACATCFGQTSFMRVTCARTTPPDPNRAQAIAIVRSLVNKNARPCRIDRIGSISATRSGVGWRVTARLVMSASGRPLNETATWTVKANNGDTVPGSQLAAEIENGCPYMAIQSQSDEPQFVADLPRTLRRYQTASLAALFVSQRQLKFAGHALVTVRGRYAAPNLESAGLSEGCRT